MKRIGLLLGDFEDGGVERSFTYLARGLACLGVATDVLCDATSHPYLLSLPDSVNLLDYTKPRLNTLREYLADAQPDWILSGKLPDDYAALSARDRTQSPTRIAAVVGTMLSQRRDARGLLLPRAWRERRRIRTRYSRLDAMAAVSREVARDLTERFGQEAERVGVVPNALIPEDLDELVCEPIEHPWLRPDQPPVVLSLGGLRKVKDHATLLRAIALVNRERECRLLVVGEGKQRARLLRLRARLSLEQLVDFPGFVVNPFPFLSKCALLAVSSRREGLGNVVVEAMATGTPVVATRCPGGIAELLDNGRLGALVKVGARAELATAILRTLAHTPDRAALRVASARFHILPAAQALLDFLVARDLATRSTRA